MAPDLPVFLASSHKLIAGGDAVYVGNSLVRGSHGKHRLMV